ncbi:hypothetical protein TNCV_2030821 [Trichonephila clavipes]|nr:hypothetical protein TNCV_2030821 [Trichonephila clavipes]
MRQARHLPQRWYWSIVLQVRDGIRQFTQGTPNCNTNPKATVFGIPKEPVLESAELITSRLTGAGSLLPPVYGEAWAKGHATGTPDSTFPDDFGHPVDGRNVHCEPTLGIGESCKKNYLAMNAVEISPLTICWRSIVASTITFGNARIATKLFNIPRSIFKHLRSHLNCLPYHCKICLQPFNKKGDLYNHKIGHDNLEKRICRVCKKTCDDHSSLTRHFLKNHGEPPYRCSECPSIFSRLYDRNTHMQKHILRCELCKIPMKSQDDLRYHFEKVHRTNNMDHVPVLTPLLEYPDNAYIG